MIPRTLIGDNCFSRQCYRVANIKYKSPFVNIVPWNSTFDLFSNIKNVNFEKIEEVKWEDYKDDPIVPSEYVENKILCILVDGKYRVFIPHYSPFDVYKDIWFRRLKEQDLNHIAFKVNYTEPHNNKHIDDFINLDYERLIFTEVGDKFDYFVNKFDMNIIDGRWAYGEKLMVLRDFEFTNFGKARRIPKIISDWLFYQ